VAVVALGREPTDDPSARVEVAGRSAAPARNVRSPARYLWALLPEREQSRLFASLPLVCPNCGAHMRIIAFVTKAAPVQRIPLALGEPTEPPPIAPARGPPGWDDDPEPTPDWDLIAQTDPGFEFDQRVSW
jgi:hypothetical protein